MEVCAEGGAGGGRRTQKKMTSQPTPRNPRYPRRSLRTRTGEESDLEDREETGQLESERGKEQRHQRCATTKAAVDATQVRAREDERRDGQRAAGKQRPGGDER